MAQTIRARTRSDLPSLLETLSSDLRAIRSRYRIPDDEADDILQESALAFLQRRTKIREPRTWLLAVYRNRCRLYWRARKRSLIRAVDSALLEGLAGTERPRQATLPLRQSLRRVLAELPTRCRRILGLRYGLDCTHPEIASRLGISKASAVRQASLRCLSALTTAFVGVDRPLGTSS